METVTHPNHFNPFSKSTYSICVTAGCQEKSQHKTGLCEKCRTKKCYECGQRFVSNKYALISKIPVCSECRRLKKRRS